MVDYAIERSNEMALVFIASYDPVLLYAPRGAEEIIFSKDHDETNQMLDSIFSSILTNSSQLNKVCLVTVYPYGELEIKYLQR